MLLVMVSLTSFLPNLPNFGLSVPALYERQRALVRSGHLPAPRGRGRGAGVEATPKSVAMLILAVAATDNLSDTTESRVQRLANAASEQTCELTGARNFAEALEILLDRPALAKRVESIIVSRSNLCAHLYWGKAKRRRYTLFGPEYPRNFDVAAYLAGEMLVYVGELLKSPGSGASA